MNPFPWWEVVLKFMFPVVECELKGSEGSGCGYRVVTPQIMIREKEYVLRFRIPLITLQVKDIDTVYFSGI